MRADEFLPVYDASAEVGAVVLLGERPGEVRTLGLVGMVREAAEGSSGGDG